MEINICCDGGARGNPGPAAIGIAAEIRNSKFKIQKHTISKRIGVATNNEAEYTAVIEALMWFVNNLPKKGQKPKKINFFLDSSLVVNQINGKYKIKKAHLRELALKIHNLEAKIDTPIFYNLIPREENNEADKLVNQALDKLNKPTASDFE